MNGDTQAALVGLVLVVFLMIGGAIGHHREVKANARLASQKRHPSNYKPRT